MTNAKSLSKSSSKTKMQVTSSGYSLVVTLKFEDKMLSFLVLIVLSIFRTYLCKGILTLFFVPIVLNGELHKSTLLCSFMKKKLTLIVKV